MLPAAELYRLFLLPGGGGARGWAPCLAVLVPAPADSSRTGGDGEGAWGAGRPGQPEASIITPLEALLILISTGQHGLPQLTSPTLRASSNTSPKAELRCHPGIPRHHPDSERSVTFTYSGGEAPAQATLVETPATEPCHSSGNNAPIRCTKRRTFQVHRSVRLAMRKTMIGQNLCLIKRLNIV